MVEDLLPLVMEPNSDLLRPGPQPHQIRKLEDPSSKDLSFALFLDAIYVVLNYSGPLVVYYGTSSIENGTVSMTAKRVLYS